MVEKILNNTTPYGKIRASHEGSLHSSTLSRFITIINYYCKSSHFSLLNTVHSMYFYCISIVTVHTQLKLYDVILMYFTVR